MVWLNKVYGDWKGLTRPSTEQVIVIQEGESPNTEDNGDVQPGGEVQSEEQQQEQQRAEQPQPGRVT